MQTIIQYPKLALLLYDSLKPYICIFDNEYLSFIDHCTKHKLLDFQKFDIINKHPDKDLTKERKKIRSFGPLLSNIQAAMEFFKDYPKSI